MNRTGLLTCAALVLAALYVYSFTDWMVKKKIQIMYRNLPKASRAAATTVADPVQFMLAPRQFRITEVKVLAPDESKTNKFSHVCWDVVAISNGVPTTDFLYGQPIKGMKSRIGQVSPDLLKPNTTYHVVVEAGKIKGERDFKTRGPVPVAASTQ
jgi:hypothetical protein